MDAVAVSAPISKPLRKASRKTSGKPSPKPKEKGTDKVSDRIAPSWRGYEEVARTACRRLREARTINGYTIEEASEKIGYHGNKTQLSLFEREERLPPVWVLIAASKLYSVPMDYLFGFVDEIEASSYDVERAVMLRSIEEALARNSASIRAYIAKQMGQGSPTVSLSRDLVAKVDAWLAAFERFQALNKAWPDMRGGGNLDKATSALRQSATTAKHLIQRYDNMLEKAIAMQRPDFGVTGDIFRTDGGHG